MSVPLWVAILALFSGSTMGLLMAGLLRAADSDAAERPASELRLTCPCCGVQHNAGTMPAEWIA